MQSKTDKYIVQLSHLLKSKKLTLVTAESCTGGGLAFYISKNPACSSLLERGYVTYSNQSKQSLLEVKPATLQTYGAVSRETAIEMAQGALKNSVAQISIAITGIAGPDKGEGKNAQGLVWICCAGILDKIQVEEKIIPGNRNSFCRQTILAALNQLVFFLDKF